MPAPSRTSVFTAAVVAALATATAWMWMRLLPLRSSFYSVDLYFLFYPAHARFGQELMRGRFPVWNSDLGLGINEAADSQFGFFYPPNLVFALMPAEWGIDVLAWFHFMLAAFGAFLLCVRCGLSGSSAAVAVVVLVCGMTMHAIAGWTTILATFAWCPVAFLAARRLADDPGVPSAVVLATVLGLQLLAGYLQFSLYTVGLIPLFLWPAEQLSARSFLRTLGWAAIAGLIGLGFAAIGILPALAAIADSVRDSRNIAEWFYEVVPVRLESYPRGLAAPALDDRIPIFVGVLAPLLALGAVVARGIEPLIRVPALLLTGLAFVLSLGKQTPVFPLLWQLPVGHLLTHPHKWVYFAALGLSLLAAVGAEFVRRGVDATARVLWLLLGLIFLAVVPFPPVTRALGAAALLLFLLASGRLRTPIAFALPLLVAATILPAYQVRAQRPSDNLNYFARYEDSYRYLAGRQDAGRTFILTPELTGSPRQGEIAGIAQVTTNGTFLSERLDRYMRVTREASRRGEHARVVALLRAVGSRFVLTGSSQLDWLADFGLKRVFSGIGSDVWEDSAALPRAFLASEIEVTPASMALDAMAAADGTANLRVTLEHEDGGVTSEPFVPFDPSDGARIVAASAHEVRIEVKAPAPSVLVLLDAWSPEWRATMDGRTLPIRHANLIARAVEVPAGTHEIVFCFVPRSLYAGAATSLLLMLLTPIAIRRARVSRVRGNRWQRPPLRRAASEPRRTRPGGPPD